MHLEPRDAERHHNICDRVRLRKQIADLGERLDVPFRHIVLLHRLYPAVLKAALFDLALPHGLHDLEAHLRVKPHGNEVEHDVVAAADRLQNACCAADDQLARVAEPHVRAVREAGKTHEGVEVLRLRVNEHLAREARVELGNGDRAGRAEQVVVLKAQHLRRGENAHRIRIVERDRAGVHAGEILEHTDHRRVIVAEHIELEEVILHAVIFKVRGYGVAVLRVGRVLHGAEILDLQIVRHDDQAAGVLARRAAHADAACRQAVDLRRARLDAVFLQIFLDKAEGGLFRQRADGARAEHLRFAEHFDGVAVRPRLILTREVQVNIRHLAAAEAEEGLKRNVKAVLDVLRAAFRAVLIRHIRAAAVAAVGDELAVPALRAAVVRRERVDLGDARHIGDERRADRPSRADQIAALQRALDELLRRHIHHVVLAEDAAQLDVQTVLDELRRLVAVKLVHLVPDEAVQILSGIFQARREELALGQQLDVLDLIRNGARVGHDHLVGLFLAEILKFTEHLVRRAEVDGQRRVRVGEFLGGQQDMAVDLVLRLLKMHIAGGDDPLAQLLAKPDDGAIEVAQLLLAPGRTLAQHEAIVADGLDLEIIVEGRDALELLPVLVVRDRTEQLARLAGRADDKSLAVRDQLALRDDGHALEILEVG